MKPKTANLLSYQTGAATTTATVDIRREVLARDGDCCHFCRAPGGATILRVKQDHFEHYVCLDTLMAFDANDGRQLGTVPADTLPLGKSRRVVLDLAYLDGNPGNLGRKGRRPNVVLACQRCNTAQGMAAIAKAEDDKRKAAIESEFGPLLPLFG